MSDIQARVHEADRPIDAAASALTNTMSTGVDSEATTGMVLRLLQAARDQLAALLAELELGR